MAFTPILSDLEISSIRYNTNFRNANRESLAHGTPVYYTPSNWPSGIWGGYGGPRYKEGYTYDNCPYPENTINGNCTWWCCGRLQDTMGTTLSNMGDAYEWYNNYNGNKSRNANNINPGDIIVFRGGDGHVMFVEKVSGNTIYISHSAYSTKTFWIGYACRVATFQKSEIVEGNSVNIYSGRDTGAFYNTVEGVIHTGAPGPGPEPGTETPTITITPSSYSKTITTGETYADFQFSIRIEGIPSGYTVRGGNTYPGLDRVYNTGWSYTDYTVDGVTYRRATKTQTLRYYRESDSAYVTRKYMYFNLSFPNGSINSTTLMTITVEENKKGLLMLEWYGGGIQIL